MRQRGVMSNAPAKPESMAAAPEGSKSGATSVSAAAVAAAAANASIEAAPELPADPTVIQLAALEAEVASLRSELRGLRAFPPPLPLTSGAPPDALEFPPRPRFLAPPAGSSEKRVVDAAIRLEQAAAGLDHRRVRLWRWVLGSVVSTLLVACLLPFIVTQVYWPVQIIVGPAASTVGQPTEEPPTRSEAQANAAAGPRQLPSTQPGAPIASPPHNASSSSTASREGRLSGCALIASQLLGTTAASPVPGSTEPCVLEAAVVATIRAQAATCSGYWAVTMAVSGDARLLPAAEASELIEKTVVLFSDGARPIALDQYWQLGRLSFDIFESAPSHPHDDTGGPTYIETMNSGCRQLAESAEGLRRVIEALEAKQ